MTRGGRGTALLLSLPDRLPVLLGCLALAGLAAVQGAVFRPAVVLPVAVLLAAATWPLVPGPPARRRGDLGALAALGVLVAAWAAVGLRSVAQYVVVNRDPGFLTLRALWLTDHASALIPVGGAAAVDAAVPAASAGTEAFWLQDGLLHAQGNTMLPALLAVQGWAGGERAVLAGGLALGAVALVALFAVARRLVGPLWALAPVAAMAASLPFGQFTRAAYTEPLTVALLCGGLAVAHGAWSARWTPRRWVARHALAGALVGAVAAARIDGAVVVVGLALGYGLVAVSTTGRRDRRAAVRATVAAVGAAVVLLVLGMVDVLRLSPAYAREHQPQITALLAATALVVVVVLALVALPGRVLAAARRAVRTRRAALGRAVAGAVVLVAVVLASRPWWYVGRHTDPASGYGYAVQVLQQAAGQALDGTRSYDEQTLTWVAWYLGWPVVVLGFAGLAVLARRAVGGRDAATTVLLAVLAVAAVFPLVRVSITPDQVWAVRRLLPATFPAVLLGTAVALAALAGARGAGRRPGRSPGGSAPVASVPVTSVPVGSVPVAPAAVASAPRAPGRAGAGTWAAVGSSSPQSPQSLRSARSAPAAHPARATAASAPSPGLRAAVAVGLALGVVAVPLTTWRGVGGVVELSGRADQAHAVCAALERVGARRVVWVHSSPFRYLATLRVVCDVEVVEVLAPPTAAELADIRAAWGPGPVAAASFGEADLPWTTPPTTFVGGTTSTTLGRTLTGPPRTVDTTWSAVWVGLVGADGTVAPVPGVSSGPAVSPSADAR